MKNKKINWDFNIGDKIDNLEITNRRMGRIQEYQYKCLKCGFDSSKNCYKNGEFYENYWISGNALKSGKRCGCCVGLIVQSGINDIATTCPETIERFYDKSVVYKYSKGSNKRTYRVCPICGIKHPTECSIHSIIKESRKCINCDDGFTFPERFVYFMLLQLNVNFNTHIKFPWSAQSLGKRKTYKYYDFYLCDYNTIIETHGAQHYDKNNAIFQNGKITFEDEINNDIQKQKMAEENGYNYIILDCRKNNSTWIINKIKESNLNSILDLSNVDWNKCSLDATTGLAKIIIEEKKKFPERTAPYLAEKYGIAHTTVQRWLKNNAKFCGYDPKIESAKGLSKPIYCPELDEAFLNAVCVKNKYGIHKSSIYSCLNGERGYKSAGKHPVTNERLHWQYITLDEYTDWLRSH